VRPCRPPLHPVRWQPPRDPGLRGPFARNERLRAAEVWPVPGTGPEDVLVTDDGTVYTGVDDGSILALCDGGDTILRVARTGGRPLGIEQLPDGRLLVCDADVGLLAVDVDGGEVEPLATAVEGVPMRFCNNAAVAPDGTIWFTDSSRTFPVQRYEGELLEARASGRLLRRDLDGDVEVVLDGLRFPNGVALHPDGDCVLVAETGGYRIIRHHLTGPAAGTSDTFAELPGFPDNLSVGPTGTVWAPLASTRNRLLDLLHPRLPVLRTAVWAVPEGLTPGPSRGVVVLGFSWDGSVTANLQRHDGAWTTATGAREHDGWLYVGSLTAPAILRVRLS
jgi:sugar lactone lactonase YvrE